VCDETGAAAEIFVADSVAAGNFKAARLWQVNLGRWNLARHLDYKILSHSNDIKFQPAQTLLIRRRFAQARLRRRKAARAETYSRGVRPHGTRPRQNPNPCVLHMKF